MAQPSVVTDSTPYLLTLDVRSLDLTDKRLSLLSSYNPDLRFELTSEGELIIMPPADSHTSWRNGRIFYRLAIWAEADGTGLEFDSSGGFTLPNGAKRSPDASWVKRERWDALTRSQQDGFAPLCPDFVIELRSPSDRISTVQAKMGEYMKNGAQLGWLIDPIQKHVYIYRPEQQVESLDDPTSVSGDPTLPGFVFEVSEIFV